MSSAAAHEPTSGTTSSASARVAELFERHGRMVYGICRTMLRDAHDAEDATQQAFLSAHRALLGGARVRDTGAWIATIARNECRFRISAGMRAPLPAAEGDVDDIPHTVDEVERRLQAGEFRDALADLPDRQREAVVLRYVYGLRYGEVATALGLSRPATEALLFRARRAMRVRLRHAVSTVLVVPLAVREELALAIPGFEVRSDSGVAAVGIAGGMLAKLASAPTAAKVATATIAISTVGAVGAVESERPAPGSRTETRLVAEAGLEVPVLGSSTSPSVVEDGNPPSAGRQVTGGARASEQREGGDQESGPDREGASAADDTGSDGAATSRVGDDDPALDQASGPDDVASDSSGPGSSESESPEPDVDRSTSGSSPSGAESSGPGSGEPETEEADDSHDGTGPSGSSGSGSDSSGSGSSGSSSDDGSSGSGSGHESDDEPDDEAP